MRTDLGRQGMVGPLDSAFFSYSRNDSEFALRLAEDLKVAGANVWLDQLDITPGQRWDRSVEDALTNCQRLLVILSPSSVNSSNVMDEVSFALETQKPVIPILHNTCTIPFRLRRVQYVDFRSDYEKALKTLLRTLGAAAVQQPTEVPSIEPTKTPEPKESATATPAAPLKEGGRSQLAMDRTTEWPQVPKSLRIVAVLVLVLAVSLIWLFFHSRNSNKSLSAEGNAQLPSRNEAANSNSPGGAEANTSPVPSQTPDAHSSLTKSSSTKAVAQTPLKVPVNEGSRSMTRPPLTTASGELAKEAEKPVGQMARDTGDAVIVCQQRTTGMVNVTASPESSYTTAGLPCGAHITVVGKKVANGASGAVTWYSVRTDKGVEGWVTASDVDFAVSSR